MRRRMSFLMLLCLSLIVSPAGIAAAEEIEDLIDIFESGSRVLAVIEGEKTISTELRPREEVHWRGAEGRVGAVLTNTHLFVISSSSQSWLALPLRPDEAAKAAVSLSPCLALLVSGYRAVGFDAASGQLIETPLPLRDRLLAAETAEQVAVVITSSRAFGLAVGTTAFCEVPLGVRETLEELRVTSRKATLRTSERLLTFDAEGCAWREHRLD